jgi:hydroxymethylbilane synthase
LLRTLEGGCSVPIGVETEWEGEVLVIHAMVLSVDGQQMVQGMKKSKPTTQEEAEEAGFAMAQDLIEKGADKILQEILLNRKIIEEAGGA